jgi:NAD(P)-dependent dehydrogenase (short-subunit alcohol dehydrogenase family)
MFRLDEKIAVITGGGSGIGRAITELFAKQGAHVHILDLDIENAMKTVTQVESQGGKATAHNSNVTNQKEVVALFEKIGPFDILVNNAGIAHVGRADNTNEEDFDRVMNVNVKGVYNCIHGAIPIFKKAGAGVILNLGSVAGLVGLTDRFAYTATKGAVMAMTISVARDYIHDNIRCNSISPARVHTPFVDGFIKKNYAGKEKETFEKLSKSQPIGRMGKPEEIAYLALYLCSNEASFITGCDYPIDGGFTKLNT